MKSAPSSAAARASSAECTERPIETAGEAPARIGRVSGRRRASCTPWRRRPRPRRAGPFTNTAASGGRASAARRGAAAASVAPPAVRSRAWSATDEPGRGDRRGADAEIGQRQHRGVGDGVQPGQRPHAGPPAAAGDAAAADPVPDAEPAAGRPAGPRAPRARRRRPATTSRPPPARTRCRARRRVVRRAGAEELERRRPSSVVHAPGAGSNARTCRATVPRVVLPVDARGVAVDLGRVGGAARDPAAPAGRAPAASSEQRLHQRGGPEIGQPLGERAGGVVEPIGVATRCSTGPLSSPASICMMLTPVSRSPSRMACWIGAAPRKRGQQRGVHVDHARARDGEHLGPQDVAVGDHHAEVGLEPPEARRGRRRPAGRSGCRTGSPARSAGSLTGGGTRVERERPCGRSGWVTTPATSWTARAAAPAATAPRIRGPEEDDPHHSGRAAAGWHLFDVAACRPCAPASPRQQHLPLDRGSGGRGRGCRRGGRSRAGWRGP